MTDLKLHRDTLERRRKTAGYTVPALAAAMGVTPQHMYRLEWGDSRPSPALYKRLKDVLGVTTEELLREYHTPGRAA